MGCLVDPLWLKWALWGVWLIFLREKGKKFLTTQQKTHLVLPKSLVPSEENKCGNYLKVKTPKKMLFHIKGFCVGCCCCVVLCEKDELDGFG